MDERQPSRVERTAVHLALGVDCERMAMSVLIGTYTRGTRSDGIYAASWDEHEATLVDLRLSARAENPSFLVHGATQRVHAVSEIDAFEGHEQGAVLSFELGARGRLHLIACSGSGGPSPCHLALNAEQSALAVANFGGSVALLPFRDDGAAGAPRDVAAHTRGSVHPARQASGHPHGVFFSGEDLLVPDLGADVVFSYQPRNGALGFAARAAELIPGAGPRLLAFHPQDPRVYVVTEMHSTLLVYRCEQSRLVLVQTVSTLPDEFTGRNAAADVKVSADGRFVYVSNRGHDSIGCWRIEDDGLEPLGWTATSGQHPRSFVLSPDGRYLLVANRDSSCIVVLARDVRGGALDDVPVSVLPVPAPSSLLFVEE